MIDGTHEDGYARLPQYCEYIVNSNPGSVAFVESTPNNQFRRAFICFNASAEGLPYCVPVIGLDGMLPMLCCFLTGLGTHLMSKYQGILLSATSVDARGSLFPVAHAIVDAENDVNWAWFCKTLRDKVILPHKPQFVPLGQVVFLSDRQKGLLEAVHDMFPHNAHGYCLRHLEENFHKQFKNAELKSLLWQAARAVSKSEYDAAITNMSSINSRCVKWLTDHAAPVHWAEIYFQGHRYGHLTSNIAESLNAWLKEACEMPILALLKKIHHQLMDWMHARRALEITTTGLLVSPVTTIQALCGANGRLLERYIG
jgi:hypothetical protein